ncbi:hypothetical protein F5882DRAFT_310137, partial [Hyaloscypha sp. PMI_1271]
LIGQANLENLQIVGLRLYAQFVSRHLDLGDAIMTLSMICGILLCSMLTTQHHYGLGRHFFYLSPTQRILAIKFNFLGQAFGIMGPAFGRMASCLLMLKLFGTKQRLRQLLWFIFWESLVVNAITLILVFVQCKDVQSLWDPAGHPPVCWSPKVQEITLTISTALNSATDLALTILPSTIFWTLQINVRLKLGLGFLLSLSIFAFIACIIKTVLLQSLGEREDFTFNTVPFFTWVIAEITLVNIAASVPLIRPLFKRPSTNAGNTSYEMKNQYASANKGTRLRSRDIESGKHSIDNTSEENILPIEGVTVTRGGYGSGVEVDKNGIMLSTSYVVSYNENDEEGGMPGKKGRGLLGAAPTKR